MAISVLAQRARTAKPVRQSQEFSEKHFLGLFLAKGNDNSIGRPSASDYLERSFAISTVCDFARQDLHRSNSGNTGGNTAGIPSNSKSWAVFAGKCDVARPQRAFYLPGQLKLPTMGKWERFSMRPPFPPFFAEKDVKSKAYRPAGQTMIERGDRERQQAERCQNAGNDKVFDLLPSAPS